MGLPLDIALMFLYNMRDLRGPYSISTGKNLKIDETAFFGSRRLKLLLGTLIAVGVADGIISRFIIVEKRLAREVNPFVQAWIGEDAFLVIKLAGTCLAAIILWDVYKRLPRVSFICTVCCVAFYTVLVFWSLLIFFTHHTGVFHG